VRVRHRGKVPEPERQAQERKQNVVARHAHRPPIHDSPFVPPRPNDKKKKGKGRKEKKDHPKVWSPEPAISEQIVKEE